MDWTERADNFLRRHGLHPAAVDFGSVRASFAAEMRAGLDGRASSLQMIPTYLSADGQPEDGRTALAVDIGGTNLRVTLARAVGGSVVTGRIDVSPVPGSREEITKEEFLAQVASRMLPFAGDTDTVGICFSHSAEILPNRDGRMQAFSKEIRVTGAAGMEICRELKRTLQAMGGSGFEKFILLNDTAAVLLSGANRSGGPCRGQAGFVLGTGMNISYVERTDRIRKARGLFSGATMAVNTEAGGFDKLPFGDLDEAFFETTADAREHRLEKITAGRYLGELILFILKRAAGDGLFSAGAAGELLKAGTLPTPETSVFLSEPRGSGTLSALCRTDGDRAVLSCVVDRLYARAAKLSAAAITAVLDESEESATADAPACVTAEGSTFYKLHSFREKFDSYIREEFGRGLRIVSADNATIVGTALAALLQK